MSTVADLIKNKGNQIYSVNPDTPTIEALRLMSDKKVGALLVLDQGALAGIISERDFVQQVAKYGMCYPDVPVKTFMTEHLFTVSSSQSVADCMTIMTEKHIRHLPVVDDGQLKGVISIGDVVKQAIAVREERIEHLENYMAGRS
jgi:CBS domain-containing protein